MFVNYTFPDDLILSKDSLEVCNNLSGTFEDQITIKNSSDDSIFLDSAYFTYDDFDTTDMHGKIEIHWMEYMYGDFGWNLNEIGKNTYKLDKLYFSPNDTATPLRFFPGNSCVLVNLQIGINLVSEKRPIYPKYIKGYLRLFFSNSQIVVIKLYSDDLRVDIFSHIMDRIKNHNEKNNYEYYLLNGRRMPQAQTTSMPGPQYIRHALGTVVAIGRPAEAETVKKVISGIDRVK
jgi:hypothetical protein